MKRNILADLERTTRDEARRDARGNLRKKEVSTEGGGAEFGLLVRPG